MTAAGFAWLDGAITELDAARVPVTDPGFLLGHGVFETMKADLTGPPMPYAFRRHLDRLRRSAAITRTPLPHGPDELRTAIGWVTDALRRELAGSRDADDIGFIRIRLTVTAGGSTLVTAIPAPAWPATTTLATIDAPINERSPLRGAKTISHLEETWCRHEAERLGVAEVVRTDTRGHLAEGSASNLFLIVNGRVLTPSLRTGCLPGITRGLVLEIAAVEERDDLAPDDLRRADEVFVTSSTRDVHPVAVVDGRRLDAPGPITGDIAARYRSRLGSEPDP